MIRNLTFLSYFALLLLAVIYPGNQQPAGTVISYAVASKKDSIRSASAYVNSASDDLSAISEKEAVDNPYDNMIDVPDAPPAEAYVPTSIKDFKMADPAEGISLINAPTANNSGNAVLSFAMKLPDGRLGIQPDLTIQYNNEGGSSWLGTGWNMATPAISIETRWGSPRYDAGLETEMYLLNGEQMAPVNNRSELVARAAEKRFYQRVEGNFYKIIRHGSSPAGYWWEVTAKNGVRSFYGGKPGTGIVDNAVLKDDLGNIGYWALVEMRDASDNFVHYTYETVNDPGVEGGSVQGRQLYFSQISYTGSGTTDGPYKIEFIRDRDLGEAKRKDITIDGRLGFKMVSADLLRKVSISINGTPIRRYEYAYEEGAFYKTLLKSISEVDADGKTFYTHNFDYYDDVNKADYTPTSGITSWTIDNDGIRGDIENPIPGFTSEGTAISTSKASSLSTGVAVTVGSVTGGTWSKNTTVGGSFNYGEDQQESILALIDINGDGLPDKVFKQGTLLYYRPNLGAATHSFGEQRPITGIFTFNTSSAVNIGGGVQVIPPSGFLGINFTRSTSTTQTYFSDFNGDGLMDVAVAGRVFFNRLKQGDPDFVTNSGLTPSPIFTGSIDKAFLAKDTALQSKQEQDFPLQDAIRMWQAPFTGTVNITAPIQLLDVPQAGVANNKKDGVRASIQLAGTLLNTLLIDANDHTGHALGLTGIHVNKGQRIYFRLQSRYNGQDDLVQWDPVIQYTSSTVQQSDVHHKSSNYYKASADFILHGISSSGMGKAGYIRADGTFKKDITSDSVWVMVTRKRANNTTTLFEKPYSGNELADGDLPLLDSIPVQENDEFHFVLASRSYIDRSAMQWKPHYAYVSFTDTTPVKGKNGAPTIQAYPVPDNSNYNHWQIAVPPVTVTQKDTVILWPRVTGGGDGTLWFTIKGTDTVYVRRHIFINGGAMSTAMDSIHLIRNAGEPLFMEYATDTLRGFADGLTPTVLVYKDSAYVDSTGALKDTTVLKGALQANLYANPPEPYLGPLYRGWGQFGIRGDQPDAALEEAKLNLDELSGYPSDPNNYTDSTSMAGLPNPSKTYFVMMLPDAQKNFYVGYDTSVYVAGGNVSSARLWVHDVSVDSLMAGEAAGAVYKISTTVIDSYSAGVTPGVSASAGTSFAETTTDLDMMDMNGDRYPDVLNDNMIQYTLPNGGLGTAIIPQPIGETVSKGFSWGVSLGGNFMEATTTLSPTKASIAGMKTAKNSAGLSGSINSNDDESISSWIDINGDGLIDRVFKDDTVMLNLGYRFAAPERWGLQGVDNGHSISAGAGLGINIESGSFEAGIGLSRTVGNNTFLLNDVNGDGLPDQLFMSGNDLLVRLNTGAGFGQALTWKGYDTTFSTTVSTGESINASFSIVIPILFIKIVVNPSVNFGHGVAGQKTTLMDLDGDGYADMLQSENDGHLVATASTIGRTNMLRKVKGPFSGSYFTMDYERLGNTYDMPQSKWVLKNVEVFDGAPGDGIDTTRKQFSYEGGYQDRYEREFYGFSKIITRDLNTAKNNSVYRSHIQQYLTADFYVKGLLAGEWLEDSAGHKFTQTNYLYEIDTLQDFIQFPKLVQTEQLYYEGTATATVKTEKQFTYDALGNIIHIDDAGDGTQQDLVQTDITYHNNDNLYIKSVPASVEVKTADGVKRKTTTAINGSGSITQVKQFLADGTVAQTDIEYDNYSNVSKFIRPANHKNQRMWYSYEYDPVTHSYITKTTDAFGYISSNTWDYRFGALTGAKSINDDSMRYELDSRGRIIRLTGPYELAAGKPYTIAFEYNTAAPVAYAITRHYDPEHNSDINIINFDDGLGRSVQVKKQVSLFKGKDVADEVKMVVSGSDLFDPFGRVEQSYYPILEPVDANNMNLNTGTGEYKQTVTWDVRDRVTSTALADGAATTIEHAFANGFFNTVITDALTNKKEVLTDVRGRRRFANEYGPDGVITTRYDYDALSELLKVTDTKGNVLTNTYDNLGRKLSVEHPDGGKTEYVYDPAGNMLKKITAQIRKEIPGLGAIQYQYDYERLTDIDYPRNYQNKVRYTYGKAGAGSKAGRLILQEDASGGQEFFYGKLGEIKKVIRTVLVNPVFAITYVSEQEYDTWNRIKKISYPDGEEVNYHYNKGGGLYSVDGKKQGHSYEYIDQAGYDEYEQRIYMRYGSGAETKYTYDNKRRRLVKLQTNTEAGRALQNNTYTYDAMNNVLSIVNDVQAQNDRLGGYAKQEFHYDNLYRLDSASGEYQGFKESSNYGAKVSYDNLYNITHKTISGVKDHSYDQLYTYGAAPHLATQIGANTYKYDANGNQMGFGDIENFFDEENRVVAVVNKGVVSQYTYDAGGERVIASSGGIQGVWLNGAPAGAVRHADNYTIYVSPFISCKRTSYTKHYFIEDERIATKLGHGRFTNISFPQPGLTAGNIDYTKRAAQIEKNLQDFYATLGVSPGPPTDKNFWARPENSGIPAPVFTDSSANVTPRGWPGNTTPPPNGPPIFVGSIPSNDSVKAGYGFEDPGHLYESSQYFYHPDHLGSTSYVSNTLGEVSMHFEYSPFGETFFEEHTSSYVTPYLFKAKGRDDETGYYYYGARYYDPVLSQWLDVDRSGDQDLYELLQGIQQEIGGSSASAGGASSGDVVFGDAGAGLALASLSKQENEEEDTDKKSKKPAENKSNANVSKAGVNKAPNQKPPTPAKQNQNKKNFRQQGNAAQFNGMFFNHALPNNNNNKKSPLPKTRPRR